MNQWRIPILIALALVAVVVVVLTMVHWHSDNEEQQSKPSPSKSLVSEAPSRVPEGTESTKLPKAAYTPPAVLDTQLIALVNRNEPNRVTADITTRFPRVKHSEDIPAVRAVLLDTNDGDTERNEVANLLRRTNYKGLTEDLISILNNPAEGPRFRSWCIQHLWMNHEKADAEEQQKIHETLLQAMEDRHLPVRREALLALHRLGDPKALAMAVQWLNGKEGVRDLAIRVIRERNLREYIETIRNYARDPDPVVRIAAIVTLSQWGDQASRPAFQEAAASDIPRLQRAGRLALQKLGRKP